MYKSFKFVLFNESFPNPAKFEIRPSFGQSRISAGFVKKGRISAGARAELRYSPTFCADSSWLLLLMWVTIALQSGGGECYEEYVSHGLFPLLSVPSANRYWQFPQ